MNNYKLDDDEVILFDSEVSRDDFKDNLDMMLTSKRILFKKNKKSIFKLKKENNSQIDDEVILSTIKKFNEKYQINQKGSDVFIQTTEKNFTITFNGAIEAMKFVTKIMDALTGTTMSERGTEKVKNAFNKVDEVLGFSTRDTIKGVIENGAARTLFSGIKKKKK